MMTVFQGTARLLLAILILSSSLPAPAQETLKRTYTYKRIGTLEIRADVYRKPGDAVTPAILWVHPGALIMGDRSWIEPTQVQRYLNAGFTLVAIDYRLAPQAKLPQIIEDVEDAYRWVRVEGPNLFRIDPARVAVVGHSAGGYMALLSGFRLNPRPKAVVSFYGYGDVAGDWYSRPDAFYRRQPLVSREQAAQAVGTRVLSEDPNGTRERFYLYTRQQGLWPLEVVGLDPDKETRAFDPFCPIRNVTRDFPPTLLLHGDSDTDVPVEQSVLMDREFRRQGVPHEFITMPGKGHLFDQNMQDPVVASAFEQVLAFLTKNLQ